MSLSKETVVPQLPKECGTGCSLLWGCSRLKERSQCGQYIWKSTEYPVSLALCPALAKQTKQIALLSGVMPGVPMVYRCHSDPKQEQGGSVQGDEPLHRLTSEVVLLSLPPWREGQHRWGTIAKPQEEELPRCDESAQDLEASGTVAKAQ